MHVLYNSIIQGELSLPSTISTSVDRTINYFSQVAITNTDNITQKLSFPTPKKYNASVNLVNSFVSINGHFFLSYK